MLEAVSHKGALAGAFAATALVSATGGVIVASRVARWAARLAPDDRGLTEAHAEPAPRVVVPLLKPANGQQPTTSTEGETMHPRRGAVQA